MVESEYGEIIEYMNEGTIELLNDTKILFCNTMEKLQTHSSHCYTCAVYLKCGDGDICQEGKRIITAGMSYSYTTPEWFYSQPFPHPHKIIAHSTVDKLVSE